MNLKHVGITAVLILLVSTAVGVVDPNNSTSSGDGDMSITSDGGSAVSSGGSSDGNSWQAQVTVVNRSLETSHAGTIENSSVTVVNEDRYRVQFTGNVQTLTPCHTVNHKVIEEDDRYVFQIVSSPAGNETCAQVMSTATYNAWFEVGHEFDIAVAHGEDELRTFSTPQEAQPPEEPQEQSFFGGLLNWLRNLF